MMKRYAYLGEPNGGSVLIDSTKVIAAVRSTDDKTVTLRLVGERQIVVVGSLQKISEELGTINMDLSDAANARFNRQYISYIRENDGPSITLYFDVDFSITVPGGTTDMCATILAQMDKDGIH